MSTRGPASTVLVTGASGFLGRYVVNELLRSGFHVQSALRSRTLIVQTTDSEMVWVPDLRDIEGTVSRRRWVECLGGASYVVHLAALAHVRSPKPADLDSFQAVNAHASGVLAECAAEAGVERFVYVSTAGVHGRRTLSAAINETSALQPHDVYSQSKLAGELAISRALSGARTEWVVLRPPLVFGPEPPGNLCRLSRWVDSGLPLPFGAINNRRSMISVWNLADAIGCVLRHPAAPNNAWLVADSEPVSTPELISAIARARGRPNRLVRAPVRALLSLAAMVGRGDDLARMSDNLILDCNAVRARLGWQPPLTIAEGLERAFRVDVA